MESKFSLEPDGGILVHPTIPAGLSDQEQVELVIQKLEFARAALKDGKDVSLEMAPSCAFCVSARPDDCYDCVVMRRTSLGCEDAPGMTEFRDANSRADSLAGVELMLAELRKYKECER